MTSPWLKATVLLWWLLNLTESLRNSDRLTEPSRTTTWAIARKYLRFVELTMFQLLVAAVATSLWLKAVRKEPLHPKDWNRKSLTLVTFSNLVGNLAVNLTHSTRTTHTGEVTRSCEPAVMFVFLIIFGSHQKTYRPSNLVLLGIIIMVTGSWLFVSAGDNSFNICGVVAAIAFSLRNIILRSFGAENSRESLLQKYFVISVYGFLALAPVALAKLLLTRILPLVESRMLRSTAFRVVDGLTSISILETIDPLFHAVLGVAIRFSVTMVTIVYAHMRLSWSMLVGSMVFLVGLLYYLSKNVTHRGYEDLKRIVVYVILAFYFVFSLNFFLEFMLKSTTLDSSTPAHPSQLVRTFWTYDRPPTDEILLNIKTLHAKIPSARLHVFCATFRCMEKIRDIRNPGIATSFLRFPEILQGSPLERWFSRHALHKVLSGRHFEDHTHEAARLALLWHYGGAHVDPFLRIQNVPVQEFVHTPLPWVSLISDNETGGALRACNFSRRHPFITMLARMFVDNYSNTMDSIDKLTNFVFDFHSNTSRALLRFCEKSTKYCPNVLGIKSSVSDLIDGAEGKREFVVVSQKSNADLSLGIENLVEVQFLPSVDSILESHHNKPNIKPNTTAFLSFWWKNNENALPFLRNMNFVMLSASMNSRNWPSSEYLRYLRRRAPIGCLDTKTVTFLRNNDIKAYYSRGVSLLAKSQRLSQIQRNSVYLVDVDEEVKKRLPSEILKNAIFMNHARSYNLTLNRRSVFKMAYDLIERYSTATLIITQNVRCALVSAAIDTPVIYIDSTAIPGRRSEVNYSPLVIEVTEVFRVVEANRLFVEDALMLITNSTEVIPNSNAGLLMRLRATAWSAIRRDESLRAAALRFGVVPFARPRLQRSSINTTAFHLIFTTSRRSSIVLEGLDGRETVKGAFMWRHWRCVEAIFHHHPFVRVVIHSNTLSQSTFDVLTESGYDVQVQRYSVAELARGTPAETFVRDELPYAKEGEHWYSHETDLVRLLILFKWGGIYMDTDIVVVRSLDDLPTNVVGWESNFNMNGAFLKFQKRHSFLEACLRRFSQHYSQAWSENGPLLISRVWREGAGLNDWNDVSVFPRQAFYMFSYRQIKQQCFEDISGNSYEANLEILRTKAYVVHLYSKVTAAYGMKRRKIKDRTLCKHILNSFCVLCNEVY